MPLKMKKAFLGLIVILGTASIAACDKSEDRKDSPPGIAQDNATDYSCDLGQIQEAGELIAVTLSGADTYYEYKGRGTGLQFELAEHFANSIGTKLRMETARDTAEALQKLCDGEVDLVALELPARDASYPGLRPAGSWSASADGDTSKVQWVVRKDAPLLAAALDKWYKTDIRNTLQERARQRLSAPDGGVKRRVHAPLQDRSKGIISPYDALFVRHSQSIGWDWRLMAAQCYQESAFDPEAISWTGAGGLMQIMPETAKRLGLSPHQVHQPEANIGAAARYLKELEQKFNDIPGRAERICFVLAAYNGGSGHVRDAMSLARKHGKNPYQWNDVSPFILKLAQPQFYNDPVVKYGYMRGEETSNYVTAILERWKKYRSAVSTGAGGAIPAAARRTPRNSSKSQVLSAEEVEAKAKQEL